MGYPKPLLTEMLTEIDPAMPFSGQALLDVAGKLRSAFPEVELMGQLVGTEVEASLKTRIRCWSSDKKKLVQLSPDQIVVNQVNDYLGWQEFSDLFMSVFNMLDLKDPPVQLTLQTIDQLQTSDSSFTLGKYFMCDGMRIPKWYADCREACDIVLGRGIPAEDGFNRQVTLRVRKVAASFAVRLESVCRNRLGTSPARDMLDKLHDESVDLFESLITSETRKFMGGGAS